MEFSSVEEFDKDLEKLSGRYPSLGADLINLKKFLTVYPTGYIPRVVPLSYRELSLRDGVSGFKVKHFRCKSLQGKGCLSGIRVIYALEIEIPKVTFIEMYYKERETTDCDLGRIQYYFGKKDK